MFGNAEFDEKAKFLSSHTLLFFMWACILPNTQVKKGRQEFFFFFF